MAQDLQTVSAEDHEQLEDVLLRVGITDYALAIRQKLRDDHGELDTGWIVFNARGAWYACRFWFRSVGCDAYDPIGRGNRWILIDWRFRYDAANAAEAVRLWATQNAETDAIVARQLPDNPSAQNLAKESAKIIADIN